MLPSNNPIAILRINEINHLQLYPNRRSIFCGTLAQLSCTIAEPVNACVTSHFYKPNLVRQRHAKKVFKKILPRPQAD
jgi:hypothetical protein